jgi:hypothetical protein
MNLYEPRNHQAQGQTFLDHMEALTVEDLYMKSHIAAELAHRDLIIAKLRAALPSDKYVMVERVTIALVRNCLIRDAADGRLVRGEILQLLDDSTLDFAK